MSLGIPHCLCVCVCVCVRIFLGMCVYGGVIISSRNEGACEHQKSFACCSCVLLPLLPPSYLLSSLSVSLPLSLHPPPSTPLPLPLSLHPPPSTPLPPSSTLHPPPSTPHPLPLSLHSPPSQTPPQCVQVPSQCPSPSSSLAGQTAAGL